MAEVSDQTQENEIISDEINETKEDVVKHETFQRVLRQKKASDDKASLLEKQLNEIKMRDEEREADKLKADQKFEEYSKELEGKLAKEKEEKETFQKGLLDTHKLQAVLNKLPGKPLHQAYLDFIDLDRIEVDPETGINADSVESVVNQFLTDHSVLLERPGVTLPSDAPGSTGKLTKEQWSKLPIAEKRNRLKEVVDL